MYTNSYLQNVTQNLPLNYATIIFSLSSETKPRNTALQFIFIWIIISNFILCVISIYCILSILSHIALFVYIVYIWFLSLCFTLYNPATCLQEF